MTRIAAEATNRFSSNTLPSQLNSPWSDEKMAKITPGRSDQWCACYDWLWWLKCWTHWWSEHHQLSNGRERVNNRETEKEEKGATPPPFTVCCIMTGRAWNSIITGSYIWPAIRHLTTDIDRFWQIGYLPPSCYDVVAAVTAWSTPPEHERDQQQSLPNTARKKKLKPHVKNCFVKKRLQSDLDERMGEYISRDHGFGCHFAPTPTVGPLIMVTQWEGGPSVD